MTNETVVMEIVRWHGKSSGAFAFALIFLPHFLHQGKKWDRDFEKQKKEHIQPRLVQIMINKLRHNCSMLKRTMKRASQQTMNTNPEAGNQE